MRYRYEINKENAVKVWDDKTPNENGAPFFYQPDRPGGLPWEDRAEAQAWVDAFIAELAPEPLTVPVDEQALESARAKLAALGLTEEEIGALLK